jgi:hypothetical protein
MGAFLVCCCGTFCGKVDAARELIAEAGPFRPEDLKGCLK